MGNISKSNLMDKDIRNLEIKNNRYIKAVGNPKELYIFVYSSGMKTFMLKVENSYTKIDEFREGIYSVAEARKNALKLLKELKSGKDLDTIKGKGEKYKFVNLFNLYIKQKATKELSKDYTDKIVKNFEKYILPSLGNKDAKDIKYSEILAILRAIYNPNNPQGSRLETIHRIINHLHNIFKIAIKDRYIEYDPSFGLGDEFETSTKYKQKKGLDTRLPSLTEKDDIKEFIKLLKTDNKMEIQTKRAIYLQILTANRPSNTVEAKWADIDFKKGIWTIKNIEMKMKNLHIIPLNSYMIKILKEQMQFSGNNEFVFPAINKLGHLHENSLSKAIRNLGGTNNYKGKATAHGFRATFKTICSLNDAELIKLGISEKVVENCLAHKEQNQIKYAYERQTATIEQKRALLQWYGDYLNSIEPLGI